MIKEISRNDVIPFMRMASKDGVLFNSKEVIYYGYFIDGKLVGFTPQSLPLHIKNGGKVGRQYAHSVKVVYESL